VPSRIASLAAVALLAGIVFSVRDLLLPAPRQVPLPLEGLVIVGWVVGLATIGWTCAQLAGPLLGLILAPLAGVAAVGVAIASKMLRYPSAPLVGDGFEILIWAYTVIALVGAVVGLHPALRARSRDLATTIGSGLIAAAGTVSAIPYLLAMR
jgi:hypothetical protein